LLYLTLFPFRFDFASPQSRNSSPFFLGPLSSTATLSQVFLNVLLFVPFVLDFPRIYASGRQQRPNARTGLGRRAVLSYVVEFSVLYPDAHSGWDASLPIPMGAVAGCSCSVNGRNVVDALSEWKAGQRPGLSLRRASIFLLPPLVFHHPIDSLAERTALSNWDTAVPMFVGSDGTAPARVERADRKAPSVEPGSLQTSRRRSSRSGEPAPGTETGLLASYELTGAPPYDDQMKSLPALT